eukprot:351259_1
MAPLSCRSVERFLRRILAISNYLEVSSLKMSGIKKQGKLATATVVITEPRLVEMPAPGPGLVDMPVQPDDNRKWTLIQAHRVMKPVGTGKWKLSQTHRCMQSDGVEITAPPMRKTCIHGLECACLTDSCD